MILLTPLWEEVFFVTVSSGLPKWLEINNSHLVKRLKIGSLFTNYLNFDLSQFFPCPLIGHQHHDAINVSINAFFVTKNHSKSGEFKQLLYFITPSTKVV